VKLFTDAESAVRDASWCSIYHGHPFAVIYSNDGFYVCELSKVKITDKIAEVIYDLAATIRFSDYKPPNEGGEEGRIKESARRNEAARKITCGANL
jgi:hypothetical protein